MECRIGGLGSRVESQGQGLISSWDRGLGVEVGVEVGVSSRGRGQSRFSVRVKVGSWVLGWGQVLWSGSGLRSRVGSGSRSRVDVKVESWVLGRVRSHVRVRVVIGSRVSNRGRGQVSGWELRSGFDLGFSKSDSSLGSIIGI